MKEKPDHIASNQANDHLEMNGSALSELAQLFQTAHETGLRYQQLVQALPAAIYTCDAAGRILLYNEAAVELWGRKPDIGKDLWCGSWRIFRPDGSPLPLEECPMAIALREGRAVYNEEIIIERPDGSRRHVLPHPRPIFDSSGRVVEAVNMLVDITHQGNGKALLQDLIQEKTSDLIKVNLELERSNKDLEQFAYVASHDLQEPLRKIMTFTHLLQKHNEGQLDGESTLYIDKILRATNRLTKLIDDLLNFSRLSRSDAQFTKTDLGQVWRTIKNDFEVSIRQKSAVIREHGLPSIASVPLQMSQLFQNLLSNSLKFCNPDLPPVIEIFCRKITPDEAATHPELQRGVPHYEIKFRDNGIGFEHEYADKIFLIFQRLHGQYDYPGSGIGLALCRKIIMNHKGKIYATSEPGKGSCFYILLPETTSP